MPPRNKPIVTSTSVISNFSIPALFTKAENKASAVTAAEAIAKPFAIAAVVLPSESNSSVASLTSGGKCAISAIPPALSAIGPYASTATVIPSVERTPIAAIAIPYIPPPSSKAQLPAVYAP